MARFKISEAAKLVGIDRKTIYKHIKKGKISAGVDDFGQKYIEASELHRAYGDFKKTDDTSDRQATATLETVVDELRQLKEVHRETLEELKQIKKQIQTQNLLPSPKKTDQVSKKHQFSDIMKKIKENQKSNTDTK